MSVPANYEVSEELALKLNRLRQFKKRIPKLHKDVEELQRLMLRTDVTVGMMRQNMQALRRKLATLEEWRDEHGDLQAEVMQMFPCCVSRNRKCAIQ